MGKSKCHENEVGLLSQLCYLKHFKIVLTLNDLLTYANMLRCS